MAVMEVEGPNRPVFMPGCGPRCVFAHTGITQFLKKKGGKMPCPTIGCGKTLVAKELKPCQKMLKLLRERYSEMAQEEDADDQGLFVD